MMFHYLVQMPVLPISHHPRQNQAEGGTTKFIVNSIQLSDQMDLPVAEFHVV